MAIVGIDLGTTNSLVAVFRDGQPELIPNAAGDVLTPSVVGLSEADTILIGAAAKARLVTHPGRTVGLFKWTMGAARRYRIGHKSLTSEELSALLLRALKADAEAYLGAQVDEAVISVPAYFNELQRKAVRKACQMAGMTPRRLINEPTAAALAYGLQEIAAEQTILVFDLGGGTFDVSILEVYEGVMEVKATSGDARLGGEDFTAALADHLATAAGLVYLKRQTKAALLRCAEDAKRALSDRDEVEIDATIADEEIKSALTRAKFEEITAPLLVRLHRPVQRAMSDAGLQAEDVDRVVLVGGATRMPIVRAMIAKRMQRMPEFGLDPDQVVALGAAVQAGLVTRDAALDEVVMTDVSAFTLGIEISRQIRGRPEPGYFLPIIERNTVVPVSREEVVEPVSRHQTAITVAVYQGEAPMVEDNIALGKLMVPVSAAADETDRGVAIRFTYDVSGLLEVDATVRATGKSERAVIRELAGDVSEDEIATSFERLAALKVHPRDQEENITLRSRIAECYAMSRFEQREALQDLLQGFDDVLARQDPVEIAEYRVWLEPVVAGYEGKYIV